MGLLQVDVELDVAMELFQAADQFGVERLKRMCESTMLASIEVENAASIFHAADERNAKVGFVSTWEREECGGMAGGVAPFFFFESAYMTSAISGLDL